MSALASTDTTTQHHDHVPSRCASRSATEGSSPSGTLTALARSVTESLARTGKWAEWAGAEPRLTCFASLEEALAGREHRDERCLEVVAGLTALGSRRGGDDDEAAVAAVVMLEHGIRRLGRDLYGVCELDDVVAVVWEQVKASEPHLDHAADYLLRRARRSLTRPSRGMVPRLRTVSLDRRLGWAGHPRDLGRHRILDGDPALMVPEVEDPAADLADLLAWARGVGVIAPEEADLLLRLIAADHAGLSAEDTQRLLGQGCSVTMRTIRRRSAAAVSRLRKAAPCYLAVTA